MTDLTDMSEAEPSAASRSPGSSPIPLGSDDGVPPEPTRTGAPSRSLLPPDVEGFIEPIPPLPELLDWLAKPADPARTEPLLACIVGEPGTGKTALAVHVAHRLQAVYPDGQLYASLEMAPPSEVRRQFLRALGVDWHELDPAGEPDRYQLLLSGMRVLIVLDGAESTDHVQSLLPHNPSCSVIVTSRSPLSGLPGARTFQLQSRNESLAREMFRTALDRTGRPSDETLLNLLADRFNTPLAARLAASLIRDGGTTPAALLEPLGGDTTIKAALDKAYAHLQPAEARLLRFLALLDRPAVEPGLVAALLDSNLTDAAAAITGLVRGSFVNETESGEYILHRIIRDFAKERLDQEESSEAQRAARSRADRWIASPTFLVRMIV